jgi:hypothetical protein
MLSDLKKVCLTIETQDFTNPLTMEQDNYKERIKDFLAMQKATLTFKATQAGLDDVLVKEFLQVEKISDFDFDNFVSRFGLKKDEVAKGLKERRKKNREIRQKAIEAERALQEKLD